MNIKIKLFYCIAIFNFSTIFAFAALKFESDNLTIKSSVGQKTLQASFKFKNVGTETVAIMLVKPSCGCTSASLKKARYSPGETGSIDLVFTIGDREGLQSKTIAVETDESTKNSYLLFFNVDIPQPVKFDTSIIFWQHNADAATKIVNVSYSDGNVFTIIPPQDNKNNFSVKIKEGNEKSSAQILITPLDTKIAIERQLSFEFKRNDGIILKKSLLLRILPSSHDVNPLSQ